MSSRIVAPALARIPRGAEIRDVLGAALDAVDPAVVVERELIPLGDSAVRIGEFVFDLAPSARVFVVGAGKASEAMAGGIVRRLGSRVHGGVVVAKHPEAERVGRVEIVCGDHPVPGAASLAAGEKIRALLEQTRPEDMVLCPISGGASSLLCDPTIPLADLQAITRSCLERGIPIHDLNALRRLVDRFKAGGLAGLAMPATVVGLLISDVPGDALELIGSGPTVVAANDLVVAQDVVDRHQLATELPGSILARLDDPSAPVELVAGRVHQVLLARNGDAREAAARRANALGLASVVLLPQLDGEARTEGRRLGELLARFPDDLPVRPPACLVTGGETTVRVRGGGRGGRNLELALASAPFLAGSMESVLVTLATDGEDGPTDAAGAVVTGHTVALAEAANLDIEDHLARNDSYNFFDPLGALIRTGPSGTNVCDLAFLFRF